VALCNICFRWKFERGRFRGSGNIKGGIKIQKERKHELKRFPTREKDKISSNAYRLVNIQKRPKSVAHWRFTAVLRFSSHRKQWKPKIQRSAQFFRGWNSKFCVRSLCALSPATRVQNFRPIGWTSCEKNVFLRKPPIGRNANAKFKGAANFFSGGNSKFCPTRFCAMPPSRGMWNFSLIGAEMEEWIYFIEIGHYSAGTQ